MTTLKKLIIHIGQTKTATTSLQFFLSRNKERLQANGVTYLDLPNTRGHISHRYVYNLLMLRNAELEGQKDQHKKCLQKFFPRSSNGTQQNPEDFFINSLKNCATETGLCSEELFWHLGDFDQEKRRRCLNSLKDLLRKSAPQITIKIVIYLRPQDCWLESWHNQLIKDRYLQISIQQMLSRHIQLGAYNYLGILDDWLELIQPDEVIVRPFLPNMLLNNSIYDDFLVNGLGLAPSPHYEIPNRRIQLSLHPAVCAFVIRNNLMLKSNYKKVLREMSVAAQQYKPFQNVPFTLLKDEGRRNLQESTSVWNRDLAAHFDFNVKLSDFFTWGKTPVPMPLPNKIRKRFLHIIG